VQPVARTIYKYGMFAKLMDWIKVQRTKKETTKEDLVNIDKLFDASNRKESAVRRILDNKSRSF